MNVRRTNLPQDTKAVYCVTWIFGALRGNAHTTIWSRVFDGAIHLFRANLSGCKLPEHAGDTVSAGKMHDDAHLNTLVRTCCAAKLAADSTCHVVSARQFALPCYVACDNKTDEAGSRGGSRLVQLANARLSGVGRPWPSSLPRLLL